MFRVADPAFVVVDGDGDSGAALVRALRHRYSADYRIFEERSASGGLALLGRLRDAGEQVAVVIASLELPDMTGVDFLARTRELHPAVRRALIYDVTEEEAAAPHISQGMTLGWVDTWIF